MLNQGAFVMRMTSTMLPGRFDAACRVIHLQITRESPYTKASEKHKFPRDMSPSTCRRTLAWPARGLGTGTHQGNLVQPPRQSCLWRPARDAKAVPQCESRQDGTNRRRPGKKVRQLQSTSQSINKSRTKFTRARKPTASGVYWYLQESYAVTKR